VANPGFETSLSGWNKGTTRTTLARTCAIRHGGLCSAELGRTLSSGDAVLDDSPNTVASTAAGATYAASVWVRAPSGRSIALRLREYSGGQVLRYRTVTASGNGAWRQLTLTSHPTSGGTSLSLDVIVLLTTSLKAQVDDVSLKRN
jgi:hypothetical protein